MNDRQSLDQIDRRGASAATDARARASGRPRLAFDPDQARTLPAPARQSDHRRSRRPFVAVAAAVAVVVGGIAVGVAQHRTNDGDSRPAGVTTVQLRPFLATELPKGMVLAGASGAAPSGEKFPPMMVYGTAPDHPTVGIIVIEDDDPRQFADWPRVSVDGRSVATEERGAYGRRAAVVVHGDRSVVVSSPTLSVANLGKLVDEVTLDGSRAVVSKSALPDGVHLLSGEADPAADSGIISFLRGGG